MPLGYGIKLEFQLGRGAGRQTRHQASGIGINPQFDPTVRAKLRAPHRITGRIICGQRGDTAFVFRRQHKMQRGCGKRGPTRWLAGAFTDAHKPVTRNGTARHRDRRDIDNRLPLAGCRIRAKRQNLWSRAARQILQANLPGACVYPSVQQVARPLYLNSGPKPAPDQAGPLALPFGHQSALQGGTPRPEAAGQRHDLCRLANKLCYPCGRGSHKHHNYKNQETKA